MNCKVRMNLDSNIPVSDHVLTELNSQMRRIDLFCKLVGPLAIALVDGISTRIAVAVTFAMTCVSVGVEYFAIAKVRHLQIPMKTQIVPITLTQVYESVEDLQKPPSVPKTTTPESTATNNPVLTLIIHHCSSALDNLTLYATHPSFLPSLSLSLLYLTVFSFGGQLITYLLSLHLTTPTIGALRTLSTILELSATWLAPKVMTRIGPIRAGIWFLNWQIAMVGLAAGMLWLDDSTFATVGLLAGVILSRVGLWGFDLSAQIIIQEVRPFGSFADCAFPLRSFVSLILYTNTCLGQPTPLSTITALFSSVITPPSSPPSPPLPCPPYQTTNPKTKYTVSPPKPTRRLFRPRSQRAKHIRTPLLCLDNRLCETRALQIPSHHQRRSGGGRRRLVCDVCEKEAGPSVPRFEMHQGERRRRGGPDEEVGEEGDRWSWWVGGGGAG